MPNHVTTVLAGAPEVLHSLLDAEGNVDFNSLIPQPPNIETGGCPGFHEPGVVCWYEWNVANWGTKWPGYDTSIKALRGDRAELRFDTAWSHPMPVIIALSKKWPDYEIEVKYADEDLGNNLGQYSIKNGLVTTAGPILTENSEGALDFAAQIKYGVTYAELQTEWGED